MSTADELPPVYQRVIRGRAEAFVWRDAAPWLESVLDTGIRAWASAQGAGSGTRFGGRGPVYVVAAPRPGPDARAEWVVRHYQRGGLAAPLLGDRYLVAGVARPLAEIRASVEARRRGVRTPAVIAGVVYSGLAGAFYRADLVTELVPGVRSLSDVLFGESDRRERVIAPAEALRQAGRMVRRLADAGVQHADLNAGNVLVDAGAREAWVVDLDRCRFLDARAGALAATMLRRLERSLRKLGAAHGRTIHEDELAGLRGAYQEDG
ncbi:MAG: lipopolysaccharide kinase InaA family protein [Gemmatimonadota bacterium]